MIKKKSIAGMKQSVERKRLRLEEQLLESQLDWMDGVQFVDPRGAYRDDETGEMWDAVGGSGSIFEEQTAPFRNEHEHAAIRRRCRLIAQRNPYAENLLTNLSSFTIGKGHQYKVVAKKKFAERGVDIFVDALQRYVDRLLKINKWKHRQMEICRRRHRDGEAFIRIFLQDDGTALWRFVEPVDVTTPSSKQKDDSTSFGIQTDPDDVETVMHYYVGEDEEVPYYEMQHRKANVDVNCKRGLSSLWCVLQNLERGAALLKNMSIVVQTQSSIALIRKHDASSKAVKSFAQNQASFRTTDRITGEDRNFKRLRPGTIIDAKKGTEYEFPAVGLDPSAPVEVLGAELRAVASSKSLPEYMVGSDASNANYSSTMVSESPAVRYFESEQEETIEADLELIWMAVRHAIDTGNLKPECRKYCEIVVSAPKLVTRNPKEVAETDEIYGRMKVKSPQTMAGELGLDCEQEKENWNEVEDSEYGMAGDAGGGQEGLAAQAEGAPEAALLSMAGGITGAVEIAKAVSSGELPRESAIEMYQLFYQVDEETATRLVGPPQPKRIAPPNPLLAGMPPGKGGLLPGAPKILNAKFKESIGSKKNLIENCGTGGGGFKPGNTCAGGGGGRKSAGGNKFAIDPARNKIINDVLDKIDASKMSHDDFIKAVKSELKTGLNSMLKKSEEAKIKSYLKGQGFEPSLSKKELKLKAMAPPTSPGPGGPGSKYTSIQQKKEMTAKPRAAASSEHAAKMKELEVRHAAMKARADASQAKLDSEKAAMAKMEAKMKALKSEVPSTPDPFNSKFVKKGDPLAPTLKPNQSPEAAAIKAANAAKQVGFTKEQQDAIFAKSKALEVASVAGMKSIGTVDLKAPGMVDLNSPTAIAPYLRPVKNLSVNERAALKTYTGSSFSSINGVFRKCGDSPDCWKSTAPALAYKMELMQKAASMPLPKETTVFRGIKGEAAEKMIANATIGSEMQMKGMVSTSMNYNTAVSFKGDGNQGVLLKIKAKTGVYVNPISLHNGEHEVVQKHGVKYRVTNVGAMQYGKFAGNVFRTIELEEID